jgi:hypothetical protein
MKISDEHMNEFIRLYEVKYGIKLEYQEAYEKHRASYALLR